MQNTYECALTFAAGRRSEGQGGGQDADAGHERVDQPVQQPGQPAADSEQAGGPGLHQVQEDAGGAAEAGDGAGGHAAGAADQDAAGAADQDAAGAADEDSAGADEVAAGAAAEDCEPPAIDLRPGDATVGRFDKQEMVQL